MSQLEEKLQGFFDKCNLHDVNDKGMTIIKELKNVQKCRLNDLLSY